MCNDDHHRQLKKKRILLMTIVVITFSCDKTLKEQLFVFLLSTLQVTQCGVVEHIMNWVKFKAQVK